MEITFAYNKRVSKSKLELLPDTNSILKALVSVIIEQTLLKLGDTKLYFKVGHILYESHHSYIPDCYDHPEYLTEVFRKLDGSSYLVVADSIKAQLEEYGHIKPIKEFLEKINEIQCNH